MTPDYFTTIGAPLVDGRDFTERDDETQPRVVIVNEAFAARFFPGARAIGKRIATGATSRFEKGEGPHYREIVGVVGNVRQSPLGRDTEPIYYVPYRQMPWQAPTLLVRTTTASTPTDVRRAVAALDPNVPVEVRTVQSVFDESMTAPRLATWLMGSFAGIGLLLTATGLYGLLSYAVLRRTREIGVRLALGASRGRIVGQVVSRALVLVGVGLAIGSFGAMAVSSLLRRVIVRARRRAGRCDSWPSSAVIVLTAALAAARSRAARGVDRSHAGAARRLTRLTRLADADGSLRAISSRFLEPAERPPGALVGRHRRGILARLPDQIANRLLLGRGRRSHVLVERAGSAFGMCWSARPRTTTAASARTAARSSASRRSSARGAASRAGRRPRPCRPGRRAALPSAS